MQSRMRWRPGLLWWTIDATRLLLVLFAIARVGDAGTLDYSLTSGRPHTTINGPDPFPGTCTPTTGQFSLVVDCSGPDLFVRQIAKASITPIPFQISVDGEAGEVRAGIDGPFWFVDVRATATYTSAFVANGGLGQGFLDFDVFGGGTNQFSGVITLPEFGIFGRSSGLHPGGGHFRISITFGLPIAYAISVTSFSFDPPEGFIEGTIMFADFAVTDADGATIPGASISEVNATTSEVPEPATGMICGVGVLLFARGATRRVLRVLS